MSEQFNEKIALDKFRQWHFWWLVVFSFLLVMVFVYYLPTMFLNQSMNMTMPMPSGMVMPSDMVMPQVSATPTMSNMPGMSNMPTPSTSSTGSPQATPVLSPTSSMAPGTMIMPDGTIMVMAGSTMYYKEADVKEGLVINLNAKPVPYKVGNPVTLDFFINQKPGNIPVPVTNLQLNHEKIMHVIGVRSDMSEFFHIHPAVLSDNPAVMTVDHTFAKPGRYTIWSDIVKDNAGLVITHPELVVQGDGPTENKQVNFNRSIVVGNYEVVINTDRTVVQKRNTPISFTIYTLTGQLVEVENYLAVPMHLNIIKDDLKQFLHTHPGMPPAPMSFFPAVINTADAHDASMHAVIPGSTIDFNIAFPEPGLYKGFAQFRPKGINLPSDAAIVAEFWIKVEEKAPFFVSQWWGLLIVSVLLMAGLSWWLNGYLKVKPEDVTVKH